MARAKKTKKKRKKTVKAKKKRKKRASLKKKVKTEKGDNLKKIKIRIIGIGGGGGSMVSEIAQKVKGISFVAANSDVKALQSFGKKIKKFHFGHALTGGLGTGMNPVLGEEAAKNEKERIKKLFEDQDLIIFISCLGGGLGSGASPVFAKIARSSGSLTYGIFTLPFKFEGEKKMEMAKNSLKRLRTDLNAFSVIPNERIFQIIEKSAPLKKALSAVNKNLTESLQSLIEIIYKPGLINIDFADIKTIFEGRGRLAYLNSYEFSRGEENGIIEKVINSPLYPYSIQGAKGVMVNISGQKDLSLTQVGHISKAIADKAYKGARIIFGVARTGRVSRMRVSLLATGCTKALFGEKPKKKSRPTRKSHSVHMVQPKKKKKTKKRIKVKDSSVKVSKKIAPGLKNKIKVRKNAVQIKKEIENEEAEIISKEKLWETPSFLKRRTG
jgi:cell division protein FtsZ